MIIVSNYESFFNEMKMIKEQIIRNQNQDAEIIEKVRILIQHHQQLISGSNNNKVHSKLIRLATILSINIPSEIGQQIEKEIRTLAQSVFSNQEHKVAGTGNGIASSNLPSEELYFRIFSFLPFKDLKNLATVSRDILRISNDPYITINNINTFNVPIDKCGLSFEQMRQILQIHGLHLHYFSVESDLFSPEETLELLDLCKNVKVLDLHFPIKYIKSLKRAKCSNEISKAIIQLLDNRTALESLSIKYVPFDKEQAKLLGSLSLPNLKSIKLKQNFDRKEDFIAFVTSNICKQVTELRLCRQNSGTYAEGFDELASSNLNQLKTLQLRRCRLRDRRIEPILKTMPQLESLRVEYNDDISVYTIMAIQSFGSSKLKVLNLSYYSGRGDEIAKNIASSRKFALLETLNLQADKFEEFRITKEGANLLSFSPTLNNLKNLNLTTNPIKDEGACSIANSLTLQHLEELHLAHCHIREPETIKLLLEKLTKLKVLSINAYGKKLTKENLEAILSPEQLTKINFESAQNK